MSNLGVDFKFRAANTRCELVSVVSLAFIRPLHEDRNCICDMTFSISRCVLATRALFAKYVLGFPWFV